MPNVPLTFSSVCEHIKARSHCPGVRPGASRQFGAGGPVRTWTIPTMLRTSTVLRQILVTICPGHAKALLRDTPWPNRESPYLHLGHSSCRLYYGFTQWSNGGDTDHAGRATMMPRSKPALLFG